MDGEGAPAGKALPPRTADVMARLEHYQPTVPDELVLHVMRRNGDDGSDPQLVRLLGLAGERFLSTILTDAMQLAKRKQQMPLAARRQLGYAGPGKKDDKRTVLLAEDVGGALKDAGLNARPAPYYINHA
ncbi:TAF10 [Scenedesmus sp. PABB004]|nr:TAF10 [Scenedesmus sp. PABB004]